MKRGHVAFGFWLALAAGYVAAVVFGVYGWLTPAGLGAEVSFTNGTATITSIRPGSEPWFEGASIGDQLIAINGEPPTPENTGGDVLVTDFAFRSSATGETVSGVLSLPASEISANRISLQIIAGTFALMGLFVFARSRRTPDAVAFSWLALSAGAAIAVLPASVNGHWWARLATTGSMSVLSVLFLGFFLGFARSRSKAQVRGTALYPEWLIAPVAVVAAPYFLAGTVWPDLYSFVRLESLGLMALAVVVGLGTLVWRYTRSKSLVAREQMRIVMLGSVMGVTPLLWLSLIPMLSGAEPIVEGEVSVIGVVLIPLSMAYAILRHQLMGIRRLVHRSTAYALISGVIVAIYGTGLVVFHAVLPESETSTTLEIGFLILLFAGVPLIAGVRRRAFALVDRVLYKEVVDHPDIIRRVSLTAGTTTDSGRLAERVLKDLTDSLNLEFGAFIQNTTGAPRVLSAVGSVPAALAQAVVSQSGDAASGGGVWTINMQEAAGPILVGPIRGIRDYMGLLALGPRRSGEGFDPEDVRLLQTVSGVVTTALSRVQLLEEVRRQSGELNALGAQLEGAQQEERMAISSYLHDEPLQKVAFALAQMRQRSLPEDLATLLEDVARDLRNTSVSLSPDMLKDTGLVSTVQWLVKQPTSTSGMEVFLETDGITTSDRFEPDVELAAYRTVQEALTNCRKHAKATAVWVKLAKQDGQLLVTVDDNGVGLSGKSKSVQVDPTSGGLGLKAMRQRVSRLGGELTVEPRRTRGLSVMAKIPVPVTSSTTEAAD